MKNTDISREERKNAVRKSGIKFYPSPPTRYQQKELIEADVIKMIEDNMDVLIDAADNKKHDIDLKKIFS